MSILVKLVESIVEERITKQIEEQVLLLQISMAAASVSPNSLTFQSYLREPTTIKK